jgi:vacuolar-type H+-ATPase subunit F/Vma7
MKIKVIGEERMVGLFKLIGIEGKVASDSKQAEEILDEISKEKACVLISYSLAKQIEEKIIEVKLKSKDLILLEIPDTTGTMPEVEDVKKLLEEAVGIRF